MYEFKLYIKKISGVTLCTLVLIPDKRGALPQPQGTPRNIFRYLLSLAMYENFFVYAANLDFFLRTKKFYFIYLRKKLQNVVY